MNVPSNSIPLVILGGSDRKAAELPMDDSGRHPLIGFKAVDLKIEGRPIVERLVENLRSFGGFGPIAIAGPEAVYRAAGVDTPIIDTDGGFGENIRASVEWAQREFPSSPMAFITCDVIPQRDDLDRVMGDYSRSAPYALWAPLIRAPEDPELLGAFGWKPKYRIHPKRREAAVNILPGHLVIVDPSTMRLKFLYKLMDDAYGTRNQPLMTRKAKMLKRLLFGILAQDFRKLFSGKLPNLTWSIVRSGVRAASRLKEGTITQTELEDAVGSMFVRTDCHDKYPGRMVALPLIEALSLARDIDTHEEAQASGLEETKNY
jgi:hypothetical protein